MRCRPDARFCTPVNELNEELAAKERAAIRIGIHSGPAIVGRPLLVTAAVCNCSSDLLEFEKLPPQEVRGIEGRVMLFAARV
jgi:class 3 adenylate cyclase